MAHIYEVGHVTLTTVAVKLRNIQMCDENRSSVVYDTEVFVVVLTGGA